MAAGGAIKMRYYDIGGANSNVTHLRRLNPIIQKYLSDPQLSNYGVFEVTWTGTSLNGKTELCAPNAVFDGTSIYKPLGLVSTDAKDTVAGVGTRNCSIIYLDVNGLIKVTDYAMGGTTTTKVDTYPQRILKVYGTAWGSENDTAGTITLGSRGYQEGSTVGTLTSASASGLTASTTYYFKINVNAGGVTEYSITTGTDVTAGAVLTLINTALAAAGCVWTITQGNWRCTSNSAASSSAIAMTAGTSGTDMLANLTSWSIQGAVANTMYLTISAGYNESDNAVIYLPTNYFAQDVEMVLTQNTYANSGKSVLYADAVGMQDGSDPDFDSLSIAVNGVGSITYNDPQCWIGTVSGGAYLKFSESYVTGAETIFIRITCLVAKFNSALP